jgi:hypothetical protein
MFIWEAARQWKVTSFATRLQVFATPIARTPGSRAAGSEPSGLTSDVDHDNIPRQIGGQLAKRIATRPVFMVLPDRANTSVMFYDSSGDRLPSPIDIFTGYFRRSGGRILFRAAVSTPLRPFSFKSPEMSFHCFSSSWPIENYSSTENVTTGDSQDISLSHVLDKIYYCRICRVRHGHFSDIIAPSVVVAISTKRRKRNCAGINIISRLSSYIPTPPDCAFVDDRKTVQR